MTGLSFRTVDLAEKQTAFASLLASPVVTPWTDAILYRLVTRHERDLETWFARLGYRIVRVDRTIRLRRTPVGGPAAVPAGEPPRRRPFVLALVVAAALEDQRDDSVTLDELSDAARRTTAIHGLASYDPAQRSHRVDLVHAVRLLVSHGVLEQRTQRADLLDNWERDGAGIGAGYVIHRDAMVLLIDTRDAGLALDPHPPQPDTRGVRLLRSLVETQALHPLELDDGERAYLTNQRHRLVALAEEMTGGVVEVRSDALVLVLPSDKGLPSDLFVRFPEATAADWVALALLDGAIAASEPAALPGRRFCPAAEILALAARIHAEYGPRLTVALREGPDAVRSAAERRLVGSGLVTVTNASDWIIAPEAARYRDADLAGGAPAPTLDETLVDEIIGEDEA
jgi:Protein of unknown function (DUF2398)